MKTCQNHPGNSIFTVDFFWPRVRGVKSGEKIATVCPAGETHPLSRVLIIFIGLDAGALHAESTLSRPCLSYRPGIDDRF